MFGTSRPAFGQTSSSPFGQAQSTNTFGQQPAGTTSNMFGSTSANNAQSGFGGFGGGANTNPSQTMNSPFGMSQQPNTTTSPFGGAAAGVTAPGNALSNPPSLFGGSQSSGTTTGALSSGPMSGTGIKPFQPYTEKDVSTGYPSVFQSITCMPEYSNFSFEELRFQDYQQNRKFSTNTAGGPTNSTIASPFGQQQTNGTNNIFGLGNKNTIGASGTSPFGQQTTNSAFGQQTTNAFGQSNTSPFGQPQQQSTGLFGQQPQNNSPFGTNNAANNSPFGLNKPATSGGLFGQNQTNSTSAFGQNNTNSLFGQQQPQQNQTGAFGQNTVGNTFGSSFGQQNTNNQAGGLFGQNNNTTGTGVGGAFGQQNNTNNAFGQTNNTSGGGLFGSKPAGVSGGGLFGQPQNTTSPFGQANNTNNSPFGQMNNTNQAGTGGLFGQNNTNNAGGLFGQNNASTNSGGLFGQQNTTTNTGGLFGQQNNNNTINQQSGGLFGSKPPTNGGLFGQSNQTQQTGTGLFGSQNKPLGGGTGLFGQNNQQQQPQQQQGGLFGQNTQQPAAGGLFGNQSQQPQQPGSNGLFGQQNNSLGGNTGGLFGAKPSGTATAPFGQNNQQQSATTGLFGQAGQQNTTSTGLFGQNNQQQGTSTGGLFGNKPAGTNNVGAVGGTGSGGLFGNNNQQQNSTTGGLFGAKPADSTSSGGLFGNNTTGGLGNNTSGGLFGSKPSGTTSFGNNAAGGSNLTTGGLFGGNKPATTGSTGLFGSQNNASGGSNMGGLFNSSSIQQNQQTQSQQQPLQSNTNPYGTDELFSRVISIPNSITQPTKPSAIKVNADLKKKNSLSAAYKLVPKPLFDSKKPEVNMKVKIHLKLANSNDKETSSSNALVRKSVDSSLFNESTDEAIMNSGELLFNPDKKSFKNLIINRKKMEKEDSSPSEVKFITFKDNVESPKKTELKENSDILNKNPETPVHRLKEKTFETESTPKIDDKQSKSFHKNKIIGEDISFTDNGYYISPSFETLESFTLMELRKVENLIIGHKDFGKIEFLKPVDLSLIPLPSICGKLITFEKRCCTVSFIGEKPEKGQGLNVPAMITLVGCYPKDKSTGEPIKDPNHPILKKHIGNLKSMNDAQFESYDPETGSWSFVVEEPVV